MHVEVPHADLAKVDSVVMLTASVVATARMLPVLADTTVTMRDVTAQLPGLLLVGRHSFFLLTPLVEVNQAILAWSCIPTSQTPAALPSTWISSGPW
jgi:hypothetical protein